MIICEECNKIMIVKNTGVCVRFNENGNHTYSGDRYECPECGKTTTITAAVSYEDENPTYTDTDVWMDLTNTEYFQRKYPTVDFIALIADTGCQYCTQCEMLCESTVEDYVCHNNDWRGTISDVRGQQCDKWSFDFNKAKCDGIINEAGECIQNEYHIDNE